MKNREINPAALPKIDVGTLKAPVTGTDITDAANTQQRGSNCSRDSMDEDRPGSDRPEAAR